MISALERYILESIVKENKTLSQLHFDTSLCPKIIEKTLQKLIEKQLILKKKNHFHLQTQNLKILEKRPPEQRALELNQIVKDSIKNAMIKKTDGEFNFNKVYLNEKDHKIFEAMIRNLEDFLSGAQKYKGPTSKEVLFFWGLKSYRKIIGDLYNLNDPYLIA